MRAFVTASFTDHGKERLRRHMEVVHEDWKTVKGYPYFDGTEFAAHAAKGDDDETSDEAVGPVDITLDEARRILLDYVHLTAQAKGVTVTGPGKAN